MKDEGVKHERAAEWGMRRIAPRGVNATVRRSLGCPKIMRVRPNKAMQQTKRTEAGARAFARVFIL
jgi:hypothetical protein